MIEKTGVNFRFTLPHVAFHRQIGEFRDVLATPAGELVDEARWQARAGPLAAVESRWRFHRSADELGDARRAKFAGWIAPPKVGIDNKPGDFEYVKIAA